MQVNLWPPARRAHGSERYSGSTYNHLSDPPDRRRASLYDPQPNVLEDLFYDVLVLYKTNDSHPPLALWACQRINLIYLLNKPGPALSVLFF